MKMIKIEGELCEWLVDYLVTTIHGLQCNGSKEFEKWARSYPKEAAEVIVNAEFTNDWGYDERSEITEEEATRYAGLLLQRIVNSWCC